MTTWATPTAARLAAAVALVYLAFLPPLVIAPDERSMLAVSLSMLDGDLSVPAEMGSPGADGRSYSNWYPLNSVLALPGAFAARVVGQMAGLDPLYVAAPFAILVTVAVTAGTSAVVAGLAVRLGASPHSAALAGLAYAFTTILLVYGRSFFADPLLALLAVLGLRAALNEQRRIGVWESGICALSVLAKPTGLLVAVVLAGHHAWRGRLGRAAAAATGGIAGAAVYGIYNAVRFGSPWTFGQQWGGFTSCCVAEAVTGLLVSPGRGLLWYCPIAAVGIGAALLFVRRNRDLLPVLGLFAGFLGLHAFWGQWAGGWSWGPRLLIPALPGLVAAAAAAPRRLIATATILGFAVNAPLLFSSYQRYTTLAYDNGLSGTAQIWFVPVSPVVKAWGSAVAQVADALKADVRRVVRQAGNDDRRLADSQVYRIVPVWWWMLPVIDLPRWPGVILSALMIGTAGTLVFRGKTGAPSVHHERACSGT